MSKIWVKLAKNNVTVTIRVNQKTIEEADRLAVEKGLSRNQMVSKLIEAGVAFFKDMTPIQNAINTSRGFFDDLQLDTLAQKLKGIKMTFYHEAYLATKLTIEQRTELFKKLGLDDKQNEAYTIDTRLAESIEKGQNTYNLYQFSDRITIKLTEFGREYLLWRIGNEGMMKIKQIKPDMFKHIKIPVDEDDEEPNSKRTMTSPTKDDDDEEVEDEKPVTQSKMKKNPIEENNEEESDSKEEEDKELDITEVLEVK